VWLHKVRTTNLRHQTQTPFCLFSLFPCLVGEEFCGYRLAKWLAIQYSIKLIILLAIQVLLWFSYHGSSTNLRKYSVAIWFLNDFTEGNSNGKKSHKNTNRALGDTNAVKTTALLSHLRNNMHLL